MSTFNRNQTLSVYESLDSPLCSEPSCFNSARGGCPDSSSIDGHNRLPTAPSRISPVDAAHDDSEVAGNDSSGEQRTKVQFCRVQEFDSRRTLLLAFNVMIQMLSMLPVQSIRCRFLCIKHAAEKRRSLLPRDELKKLIVAYCGLSASSTSISEAAVAFFKPIIPDVHRKLVLGALADDSSTSVNIWSRPQVLCAFDDLEDALFDLDNASLEDVSECVERVWSCVLDLVENILEALFHSAQVAATKKRKRSESSRRRGIGGPHTQATARCNGDRARGRAGTAGSRAGGGSVSGRG